MFIKKLKIQYQYIDASKQASNNKQITTMTEIITNITDDEFNYNIYDVNNRMMLKNAHQAITMAEGWDWIRNFTGQSFMFSKDAMIGNISRNMVTLGYSGHSGSSYGWTMRCMEYLAKNGKDAFLSMCVSNNL
jgi:hypothetical protein